MSAVLGLGLVLFSLLTLALGSALLRELTRSVHDAMLPLVLVAAPACGLLAWACWYGLTDGRPRRSVSVTRASVTVRGAASGLARVPAGRVAGAVRTPRA